MEKKEQKKKAPTLKRFILSHCQEDSAEICSTISTDMFYLLLTAVATMSAVSFLLSSAASFVLRRQRWYCGITVVPPRGRYDRQHKKNESENKAQIKLKIQKKTKERRTTKNRFATQKHEQDFFHKSKQRKQNKIHKIRQNHIRSSRNSLRHLLYTLVLRIIYI